MPQGVKLTEDVLPVEQLRAWREEGLSFAEIGEKVGYSGGTVGAYAKRVLPPELCGRRRKKKKPEPQSKEDIRAELRERLKEAKARAEAKLEKRRRARESTDETEVTEKEEAVAPVAQDGETIRIAPLPDLSEGLFIAAKGDGTAALVAGPGGLQDLLGQQQAHAAWCEFLGELAPGGELDRLVDETPPRYVRTDADRWIYLRRIAAGYVVVNRRARRAARYFLATETPLTPVVSRSTARWLERLARVARWLIHREGERWTS